MEAVDQLSKRWCTILNTYCIIFIYFFFRWKNWQSTWTQMTWEESILRTSVMEFLLSKVCACSIKITYFGAANVSLFAGNVMIKDKIFAGKQQCAFLVDTGINSYNPHQSFLAFIFLSLTNKKNKNLELDFYFIFYYCVSEDCWRWPLQ